MNKRSSFHRVLRLPYHRLDKNGRYVKRTWADFFFVGIPRIVHQIWVPVTGPIENLRSIQRPIAWRIKVIIRTIPHFVLGYFTMPDRINGHEA